MNNICFTKYLPLLRKFLPIYSLFWWLLFSWIFPVGAVGYEDVNSDREDRKVDVLSDFHLFFNVDI